MFKRKQDTDSYPELPPLLDEEHQPDSGLKKRKQGCIFSLVGAVILLICALSGAWGYTRYQASRPAPTPTYPPDDGVPAQVETGLQVVSVSAGGKILPVGETLPVTLRLNPGETSLSALDTLAYPDGAFYDPESGQLIVFGPPAASGAYPSSIDFLVALRAVYNNQPLAVSIDPIGDPVTQAVRYEGPTAHTHFGWVMFEADRRMKTLSMGKDNETGALISANVPGYANLLDLQLSLGQDAQGEARRRFWFTTPHVELEQTADGYGMTIAALDLAVQTEYLDANWQTLAEQPPDPAGQAFAAHLGNNLSAYAREYPVFDELQTLAHWTALAHWLYQANLPIQPALWLTQSPQAFTSAPSTTPAITVSRQSERGNILYTISVWGGVDLGMKPVIQPASAVTKNRLKSLNDKFRAAIGSGRAQISEPGLALAPVTPISLERGLVAQVELPLSVPLSLSYTGTDWQVRVSRLNRYGTGENSYFLYDSPLLENPIVLTYSGQDKQSGAQVFTNRETGLWMAEYSNRWVLTRGEFQPDGKFSYIEGQEAHFDPDGQPLFDALNGEMVEYSHKNGQLASIIRQPEGQVNFDYDGNRLREVRSEAGQRVIFQYHNDFLMSLSADGKDFLSFEYDELGRLTREMGANGQALRETTYDALGQVLFQWQDGNGVLYDWQASGGLRLYSGAALAAWRGASSGDLSEMKIALRLVRHPAVQHLVFARQVGNDVVILADERSFRLPAYLLQNPTAFRRKLNGLLDVKPGERVLVSTGNLTGVSFQSLFADAMPLTIETVDEARVSVNLDRLNTPVLFTLNASVILNGLPKSPDELQKIGLDIKKFSLWEGQQSKFDLIVSQAGFPSVALRDRHLIDSLGNKRSILVVVAHGDEQRMYQPDGKFFDPGALTESEKQSIAQNQPLVILLSCNTGTVPPGEKSLSQKMLDLGAQLVISPNGNLPVTDASEILTQFLKNAQTMDALQAIQDAIRRIYPDLLIPSDDGLDHFFQIRTEEPDSQMEAVS